MELKDFPLLRVLNATQLRNLEAACTFRDGQKGERLIEQAVHGTELFLLLDGEVEVRVDAGEGEQSITHLTAPAVLGEMELLTGNARSASVYARSKCRLACLEYAHLRERLADGDLATLKLVAEIARVMAVRLAAVTHKLSELEASVEPSRARELKAFKAKLFGEWND